MNVLGGIDGVMSYANIAGERWGIYGEYFPVDGGVRRAERVRKTLISTLIFAVFALSYPRLSALKSAFICGLFFLFLLKQLVFDTVNHRFPTGFYNIF